MINIPGYRTIEKIYDSHTSLIYRAFREKEQDPVILKAMKEDCPCPEEIARYTQEFNITQSLRKYGVIHAFDFEMRGKAPVIVMEDFGGQSLQILNARRRFTLEETLGIAVRIADSLCQIHAERIVHKDVNPSNIVMNPSSGQLKLIDFGIATLLSTENPTVNGPYILEGTLPYISPEQTGRLNRPLDYRTDFYSFGTTLYELLTGVLPFTTDDAMEMVHCHIAREPLPPNEIDPGIPETVSQIVMKLLRKTAEERYQSARGIKADLEECLTRLRATGGIDKFPLGSRDVSDRFHVPQKLFGRERFLSTLAESIEREIPVSPAPDGSITGRGGMIMVSGRAGVGKTSLIQKACRTLVGKKGYCISGKFAQLQHDTPYLAFIQAFEGLVRYLLTENEVSLQKWKERLLAALGANARLISDTIPGIELILGPQPEVVPLPPIEAQKRFNQTIQDFVFSFTDAGCPLVIFLDDLHWADAASLRLLEVLMSGSRGRDFFLLGAFRNENLNSAHPLILTLKEIQNSGVSLSHIVLPPLRQGDIDQLVAECLGCSLEKAAPLAELVLIRTKGNPFFIREFLQSLYREGLIEFDQHECSWNWDIDKIRTRSVTENVLSLLEHRIQLLKPRTRELLKLSACLGNQFDLKSLAAVLGQAPRAISSDLMDVIAEGFVFPLRNTHGDTACAGLTADYRFSHDRVQQAAYCLIPEEQRLRMHLDVGRKLLVSTLKEELPRRILDIVNHLDMAVELIDSQTERDELAGLNLAAARKAMSSSAYEAALRYLKTGIALLGAERWDRQYDLSLDLHSCATEAAFLNVDFTEMERLAAEVVARAKTLLDTIKAREILLWSYVAQNRLQEAVDRGLEILTALGFKTSKKPGKLTILLAFLKTKFHLAGRRIEDLADLPEMTAPGKLAIMRILGIISGALHKAYPGLFPVSAFKLTEMSARYGNTDMSTVGYCGYGMMLCALGDFDKGFRFGRMAIELAERRNSRYKAMTLFVFNTLVRHWKEDIRQGLDESLKAYRAGIETGDFTYASYSLSTYSSQSFMAGKRLTELEPEVLKYRDTISELKQDGPMYSIRLIHQVLLNLMGRSGDTCRFTGDSFDEEELLPAIFEAGDRSLIFLVSYYRMQLRYFFRDFEKATEAVHLAEKHLDAVRSMAYIPPFHFYASLAGLAAFDDQDKSARRKILARAADTQRKMRKWAKHAPSNCLHKYWLLRAEIARVKGRDSQAMESYERAIELASKNGYIHEEALANELAARFYFSRNRNKAARPYLEDALSGYTRWGADAKVKSLTGDYPDILEQTEGHFEDRDQRTKSGGTSPLTMDRGGSGELDLKSVSKASQAISSEIELEGLLTRLVQIIVENAGAEKGFLILRKGDSFMVEAGLSALATQSGPLTPVPLGECGELSTAIVEYVARTGESIILSDATNEGLFTQDDYTLEKQPRSVLCTPILHHSSLTGILYLENNLTIGAFTSESVRLLGMLAAQAAISIENARLYEELRQYREHLERLVEERTEALRENQRILSTLMSNLPGMAYRCLSDSGRTVIFASEGSYDLTGYSPQELTGDQPIHFDELVHEDDREHLRRTVNSSLEQGVSFQIMYRITTRTGELKWVWEQGQGVRIPNGMIPTIEGFITDVTAHKLMEQELLKTQKLESVSVLAGGIAHDFNNLLTAIMGNITMAKLGTAVEAKETKYLKSAEEASLQARNLMQQFIAFAEGGLAVKNVESLLDVIDRAVNLALSGSSIIPRMSLARDLWPVDCDPRQIHQVLVNLIMNARESMPRGGVVDVEAKNLYYSADAVSSLERRNHIMISIRDHGKGIPEENLSKVFDPYFSTKERGIQKGMGLGLTSAYSIIKRHGGHLIVESEAGIGTTAQVYLPAQGTSTILPN
ncbi:MAG: AAA family ATPase [Syntrophobacter sp.]